MHFREMVAVGGKSSGLEDQLSTRAGSVFRVLRLLRSLLFLSARAAETGREAFRRMARKHRIRFCPQGLPSQGGRGRAITVKIISGLHANFRPQGSLMGVGEGRVGGGLEESRFLESQNELRSGNTLEPWREMDPGRQSGGEGGGAEHSPFTLKAWGSDSLRQTQGPPGLSQA